MSGPATQSISVAVRVRPFNSRELKYKSTLVINMPDTTTVEMLDPKRTATNAIPPRKFNFDHCMWTHDPADEDKFVNQVKVYETIGKTILDNCLQGFNGCLFAYGQTGSGKTYTMSGTKDDPGVIPQLAADLFRRAGEMAQTHSLAVECSFLEIYNEQAKDLLNPANIDKALKVRQHPKLGVFVDGLKKMSARSAEEIAKLIDDGTQVRTIAATQMNATSSRSHAILTLNIRVKSTETETMSVLNLVDLAGSERVASTGAEGQTLKEGANINKSLSVLGMCLGRLADIAEGRKGSHIPFRDSQLTWLLHDSLGGNSRTAMLANVSPADINFEETLSTLRFASITKKIKMTATINEDPQQKIIRELREQIAQIKDEIRMLAEGKVVQRPLISDEKNAIDLDEDSDREPDGDVMADALPGAEVDLDVRRQQLMEELEENTNLMVEWTMTAEQKEAKEEANRVAHEKQMAELQKSSNVSSSAEETFPKFLLLNEDLRMLRGADGNPLALVHNLVKPKSITTNTTSADSGGAGGGGGATAVVSAAGDSSQENTPPTRRARSGSRARSASVAPPQLFPIRGPQQQQQQQPQGGLDTDDFDDFDTGIATWLTLPAASNLSPAMRLDAIVDFHDRTVSLEFEDTSATKDEVVFVNGKPLRMLSTSRGGTSQVVSLAHNDRVIIGQVLFRVFLPIAWRAAEEGGEEETFQKEPVANTQHLELLEKFDRLTIEDEAFDEYVDEVFGHDELASPMMASILSPLSKKCSSAENLADTNNNQNLDETSNSELSATAVEVKSTVQNLINEARYARAETEEALIQQFPHDVRRELRKQDLRDSLSFDGKFALNERTEYIQEIQREQAELQAKLNERDAEIDELNKKLEQQQKEREEADRKAKEALEKEVQDSLVKAQKDAEARKKAGQAEALKIPTAVAAVKTSAQGKLAIARRVHEYEELRRELLVWKPAGPSDAKDRATYATLCDSIEKKDHPTYLAIRKMYDTSADGGEEKAPLFEAQLFKNRIKTGFFSRGGLHPCTIAIIDKFLFYFDGVAGLASPAASQIKMSGFAYMFGCEYQVIGDIEGKSALRLVSCCPRKNGQGKTDPHHPLEFAFKDIAQREEISRIIEMIRLPKPDPEVAAALAQLA